MGRDVAADRRLVAIGTALCEDAVTGLDEDAFARPSRLPGWSRKHLVAHLAANAEALGRLLHWARTGEPTPMYASPEQRDADIRAGSTRSGAELAAWFRRSARALDEAVATLPVAGWDAEVVTAQGRTVPAAEVPWMRGREVLVHAVDLGTGLSFADLPPEFLVALQAEIRARRGAAGEQVDDLAGSAADVTAYLAGRGGARVTTADGAPAPPLPPWL